MTALLFPPHLLPIPLLFPWLLADCIAEFHRVWLVLSTLGGNLRQTILFFRHANPKQRGWSNILVGKNDKMFKRQTKKMCRTWRLFFFNGIWDSWFKEIPHLLLTKYSIFSCATHIFLNSYLTCGRKILWTPFWKPQVNWVSSFIHVRFFFLLVTWKNAES